MFSFSIVFLEYLQSIAQSTTRLLIRFQFVLGLFVFLIKPRADRFALPGSSQSFAKLSYLSLTLTNLTAKEYHGFVVRMPANLLFLSILGTIISLKLTRRVDVFYTLKPFKMDKKGIMYLYVLAFGFTLRLFPKQ